MTNEAIFQFLLVILLAVLSYFVIPWIKSKIGNEKWEQLLDFIEWCVRWAEQKFSPEQNQMKKKEVYKKVFEYAEQIGIKVTGEQLDALIEGVVNAVKKG